MNRTLKATITAVLLGTATLAVAQSPAESFADYIRRSQALVGPHFKPRPAFRDTADAPIGSASFDERFAAMQRDSGYSFVDPPRRTSTQAAQPIGNESFSERFQQMQAASSNSGQWGFQPGSNELASEANSTLTLARPVIGFMRGRAGRATPAPAAPEK
jgi:hypothetical protein